MVYEDFRQNDASSARRSAHCDRPWLDPLKQLTSDKVEDRCIGIKTSFRTPVPPLMSWYMRVIIHVRGTDLWLYNWQLIRCREPNQRARCYVKWQKVCACPSTRLWAWIPLGVMRVRISKNWFNFCHQQAGGQYGPVHDITALANEGSDVMGSGWRRLNAYLQKSVKFQAVAIRLLQVHRCLQVHVIISDHQDDLLGNIKARQCHHCKGPFTEYFLLYQQCVCLNMRYQKITGW